MSGENVELVKSAYGLIRPGLQTAPEEVDRLFRDHLDARFEVHLPPDYPEGEVVFSGREGMTQFMAMLRDTWSDWRFEPEQFLDAGNRVVVSGHILAEGGASGVRMELKTTHVWTIPAGRATSMQVYRDHAEALDAVGLRE